MYFRVGYFNDSTYFIVEAEVLNTELFFNNSLLTITYSQQLTSKQVSNYNNCVRFVIIIIIYHHSILLSSVITLAVVE